VRERGTSGAACHGVGSTRTSRRRATRRSAICSLGVSPDRRRAESLELREGFACPVATHGLGAQTSVGPSRSLYTMAMGSLRRRANLRASLVAPRSGATMTLSVPICSRMASTRGKARGRQLVDTDQPLAVVRALEPFGKRRDAQLPGDGSPQLGMRRTSNQLEIRGTRVHASACGKRRTAFLPGFTSSSARPLHQVAPRTVGEMASERPGESPRRRLRSALACARTLIDELDSLTGSGPVDEAGCDVVLQIADELLRIASQLGSISGAVRGSASVHLDVDLERRAGHVEAIDVAARRDAAKSDADERAPDAHAVDLEPADLSW